MELLGKSLEDIFEAMPKKKMSYKTVAMLGIQMINILQSIHDKHIIHRDIKPDNFVLGTKDKAKYIYILDFGLAKKYRSSRTLEHYPMIYKKKLTGTARYASINALKGFEQSRRDDLEAVGYVLIYFLLGHLPWQGLPLKTKEDRYAKIMEKKQSTLSKDLCQDLPHEFEKYVDYTRGLKFEEDPNYDFLRALFVSVLTSQNCEMDYIYDWNSEDKASGSLLPVCSNMNNKLTTLNNHFNNKEKLNSSSNVIPTPAIKAKIHTECNSQLKDQSETQDNRITVVNNYVNHVNNIVFNANNKDNPEENYLKAEKHYKLQTNPDISNQNNDNNNGNDKGNSKTNGYGNSKRKTKVNEEDSLKKNNFLSNKGCNDNPIDPIANQQETVMKLGEDGLSSLTKKKNPKEKKENKCHCNMF